VQRRIGLTSAVILAKKMRARFPNIKYFLLVSIASGVPCYRLASAVLEIVLRDVVISSLQSNYSRVVQYNKGA
jgi:hypothetical protein